MHQRARKIGKWSGVVACVLIVLAWNASVRFDGGYAFQRTYIGLANGCLVLDTWARGPSGWINLGYRLMPNPTRWTPLFWTPRNRARGGCILWLPLWIPLLLTMIPTTFLCWRDNRRPPGHCASCGYNLTGNVSGVCPECGGPA